MTSNLSKSEIALQLQGQPTDYPRDKDIATLFAEMVELHGAKSALVLPNQNVALTLSYDELDRRSNAVAAELIRRGVKPGACVALCLGRSLECFVAMVGVIKAGAAYLPLDLSYPAERLRFMLDDVGAKLVLTDPAGLSRVPSHGGETLTLDAGWGSAVSTVSTVLPKGNPTDLAYVMFTSGTTGTPKGVAVPHRAIVRLVKNNWYTPIDANSVFLQLAPISFDAATLEIWGPLLNGGTCVVYPKGGVPDFDMLGRVIRECGVTHLWLTASLFNLIIDERPAALATVKELLTGGEALSVPHIRRALSVLPNTQLVNGYGPTESTTFACCYRIPRTLPADLSSIPIGHPIANTTVYLLDEQRRLVADGQEGELYIGGDGLARGYFNRDSLTAERFVQGPAGSKVQERLYRTGDRVRRKGDGTIEFLGRFDDQVKIRGHRIELAEVTACVAQHPAVGEVVALVREDSPGDRRLVAYVTAKADTVPTAGSLRSFLEHRVPEFLIPGSFVVLPRLPLNANGKVDRAALPPPDSRRPDLGQPFVAPRTPLEKRLVAIWSELLGINGVGIHDRFFELGGTSLLAARFIDRLSRELGHFIPLVALFDAPTVAQISTVLVTDFPKVVQAHFDLGAEASAADDRSRARRHQPNGAANSRSEIAVVGMGGRFPKAPDLQTFWNNLVQGKEAIAAVTAEDLVRAGKDPALLSNPDYVAATFALEDVENFDAGFFGFSPREADVMDPQLRLFVETAWTTLEHAGYDPAQYKGRIGVFGGVGRNSYLMNHLAPHPHYREMLHEYHMLVGNERDFPTTHASYRLNLTGPSVDVQTACSTSGVAIHLACQSLRAGDSDMTLVGGCKVICPNKEGYVYTEGGPLAPQGHIRAFSDDANGMVRGSGSAMLLLKRLDDAVRDGDTIYGLIKGSAINNDGADKIGFTAPSVRGQAEVIRDALEDAGVTADDISYVEAHGTGTKMGDPIEVAGLTRAYRATSERKGFCAIGSVKTNIGHLDAGATAAGVIKTLLALTNEQLPASLNFRAPNPEIDFANSPFYVNSTLAPWKRNGKPRRAGISSFGLGGTNVHVIVQEAPADAATSTGRANELILLSARSEPALQAATERLARFLNQAPELNIADVAFTLQEGRRAFAFRRAVVVHSTHDAAECLSAGDKSRFISGPACTTTPAVAFMFPGGGAQYANMARGLYETEPAFAIEIDTCARLLQPIVGLDIRTLMFPTGDVQAASRKLETPSLALPALFATEYALARLWETFGVLPSALIGHSMGEYTAACLAGVMSLQDGLALVSCRGRLFETLAEGGMLSIPLSEEQARKLLGPDIDFAAVNRPTQCVASGSVADIEAAKKKLEAAGIESTRIHINVAAHSRLVEPILNEFRAFLKNIKLSPPRIPILSNTSGAFLTDAEATDPEYWARHLRSTVQFSRGLEALFSTGQFALLEVGPGQTLSTFARQHPSRPSTSAVVSSLRHPQEAVPDEQFLCSAMGKMWVAGVQFDWKGYRKGQQRRRVGLPTYPFERQRHWVDAPAVGSKISAPVVVAAAPVAATAVPAPVAPIVTSGLPRKDRIVAELQRIISDLSGIAASAIDPNVTFLELGFDSLFLTQANGQFKAVFGVPMTVRQLLEKTPSVSALAGRLDAELPATAFPEEAPAPAAVTMALQGSAPAGLESIMQALVALQTQVLALAGGNHVAPPITLPAPAPATAAAASPPTAAAPDRTSPWQPVQKTTGNAADGLTELQRSHLAELMARVQKRTAESKRLTAANRPHLSDPRTVQGFKKLWKEMVYPIASDRAAGSRIWDVDGNEYIDLVSGYGVTFFGHTPDFIIREVEAQLRKTAAIGPQTPLAGEVTKLVCELVGMDRAALCNTGSEAVLAAIRMARTVTGKRRLATFSGHYHGIFDEVLVKGVNVRGERKSLPISPGIRADVVADVLVLDYGDPKALDQVRAKASELALVMVEPVRSRNPNNQPVEFLRAMRKLTEELGIPLLMDEMVTGFRTHPGGVQALWGIKADLATYGKVVGGGFPIGIVAGSRKYMDALDGGQWNYGDDSQPEADMTWFAGTFVRHPPALAAARAVLLRLKQEGPALQEAMAARVKRFADPLNAHFRATSTPIVIEYFSSFFVVKFETYLEYSNLLFYHLHNRGVYTYEGRPAFITTEHSDADLQLVADAMKESVAELQRAGFFPGRPLQGDDEIITIPLSEGQQEIWLATRFGNEASMAFNLASTLLLKGNLNREALSAAVDELVARHEALRAVPNSDGQTQRILSPVKAKISVNFVDLSNSDPATKERELAKNRAAEVQTPFDLDNGPLLRARLCKLADNQHLFILTAHHVVADGWSCGVLLRDLGALYAAACAGETAKLPAPLQLSQWVQQQADAQHSEERRTAMSFWLQEYKDTVPVLELPTDHPRPPLKTYQAARVNLDLDADFTKSVRGLATRLGATTFATLLGAFQTMLHRLSGQTDVVVGFSLAGQSKLGGRDLVGHCVNFLPLRMKVEANSSFAEQVMQARGKVFDAIENQQVAFGELIKRLNLKRDPSRLPLMSVAFNLDPSSKGIVFGDLEVTPGSVPRRYENFDIFFNVVELTDSLQIQCTYNEGMWDAETMDRRLLEYRTLLQSALADSSLEVGRLPMLPASERQLVVETWNPPYTEASSLVGGLADRVEAAAKRTPNATAVVYGTESLSYAELDARANQLAHQLQSMGVRTDDLVGICLERSTSMIVGMLAILKAGGAYVPVDPVNPDERLSFIMQDAKVRVLLTQESLRSRINAKDAAVLCLDADWERISSQPSTRVATAVTPQNLAYVIYTSGSTGTPKGVMVEHGQVLRLFDATRAWFNFSPSDVWTMFHSFAFDFSVWEIWGALTEGGKLVVVPYLTSRAPDEMLALLQTEGVTILNQTPSAFRQLIAADVSETSVRPLKLRHIVFGGEALELGSLRPWVARRGDTTPALINMYGITETTVHVTYRPIRRADIEAATGSMIGVPIPDLSLYIVDASLNPVPIGVPGEIVVGGAGVARGYLNRPELTAERFVASPFRSGDRLYRSGDVGRFLANRDIEYLGRADRQIKIRGFRIETGEIESAICQHMAVTDASVLALPAADGQKTLVAYVVPKSSLGDDAGPAGRDVHKQDWQGKWALLYQAGKDALKASGKDESAHLNDEAILVGLAEQSDFHAEWLEFQGQTVERILKLPLGDVMEIGCGTGQILLRIAPHARSYYGTDFAELGIAEIERQIARAGDELSRTRVAVREGVDFAGVPDRSLDTVVINSVIQYFPDAAYLLRVLRNAVQAVRAGGCIYVGDVQSRAHLFAHHVNDQLSRSPDEMPLSQVRRLVDTRVLNEDELVVDPELFLALQAQNPRISRVEFHQRRGKILNETTRFHYDVFIFVEGAASASGISFEPWTADLDSQSIANRLSSSAPKVWALQKVPNARVATDLRIAALLRRDGAAQNAAQLKAAGADGPSGVDPESLWALEQNLPYKVDVLWAVGDESTFDVVFRRLPEAGSDLVPLPLNHSTTPGNVSPLQFANSPHLKALSRSLVSDLKDFCKDKLPDYMIPSQWVLLDRLPLTANGKLDVKALPAPEHQASAAEADFVEPSGEIETAIGAVWREVLRLDSIGAHDNFFEAGGHSLLAVQAIMKLRETLSVELNLGSLFVAPTISQLAQSIAATRYLTSGSVLQGDDVEEVVI